MSKRKNTILSRKAGMVFFHGGRSHGVQEILHHIKHVAGIQLALLHQQSKRLGCICIVSHIMNGLTDLPTVPRKKNFAQNSIAAVAAQLRICVPFFTGTVADGFILSVIQRS